MDTYSQLKQLNYINSIALTKDPDITAHKH